MPEDAVELERATLVFTSINRLESPARLISSARTHYPSLAIWCGDQGGTGDELERICLKAGARHLPLAHDSGLSAARNALVKAIGTDYFILADDDFEFPPAIPFEAAIRFLDAHPDFLCVSGDLDDVRMVDGVETPITGRPRGSNLLIDENGNGVVVAPISTVGTRTIDFEGETFHVCDYVPNWGVFRRSALVDNDFWWDERFKTGGQHLDFFLRAKQRAVPLRIAFLYGLKCRHIQRRSAEYNEMRLRSDWIGAFRAKWRLRYYHQLGGVLRFFETYDHPVRIFDVRGKVDRLKAEIETLRADNAALRQAVRQREGVGSAPRPDLRDKLVEERDLLREKLAARNETVAKLVRQIKRMRGEAVPDAPAAPSPTSPRPATLRPSAAATSVRARKVFIDVGAHHGETARAAIPFDFDAIHCLEPSAAACRVLRAIRDRRLVVHPFGLAGRDGPAQLHHGAASFSASLFVDKSNVDPASTEACRVRRASAWVRETIRDGDVAILKINAEGAEVEVLEDLEAAGLLPRFARIIAFPDANKIPSLKARGAALFERLLQTAPNFRSAKTVLVGVPSDVESRTTRWLESLPEIERLPRPTG